ncbi:MAG: amidohydrolase family protein [Planctomycetota bacterium]|jgi:predicted TIM-barrel fold metal-dependent hydrolase|nr:amidohydrolase family protein [Planctomycetota bacterium]
MIVDLDTRLWPRIEDLGDELAAAVRLLGSARWLQPDATGEAHAAAIRAVDAAVVVGFRSELVRGAIPEALLRGAIERSEGRLFLARAVDPTRGDASAEVESARREGAAAIWMDPCTQGFNPTDTRAMRVFDRAEANQLPVFLGWSGPMPSSARLEFARPFLLDEVARTFPRLSMVIAGFGAPFMAETIALLGKHDRVFTTTAGAASRPWELLNALQGARDHGVDRKVCFGSGFPFDTPARAIEAIYGVNSLIHGTPLPHIARSVLREIVERDAISLLGLGVPPAPNPRDTTRALANDAALRLGGETG